jgi:hypothetical protein
MIRRLTIVCGLLTAGVACALVAGGQTLPGVPRQTASQVTVIPDRPPKPAKAQWPPVRIPPPAHPSPPFKALPPQPHPEPLHRTVSVAPAHPQPAAQSVASAGRRTVDTAVGVVKTLLSLPKLIGQRLTSAGR